jgi:electron transport complex protein RnfG
MSTKVNIPVLTLSLSLIAGLAAALLGWIYLITEAPIQLSLQEKTNVALRDVLPAFDNQPGEEMVTIEDVTFYVGRQNGQITGFAGEAITPKGYNGNITVLAGLSPGGSITTVLVTQQAETPGLGTVVAERKRVKTLRGILSGKTETGLPPNAILDQFSGKTVSAGAAPWRVTKDGGTLDAITGATITSRAVADAVFVIAEAYAQNRDQILKEAN